MGNPLTAVKSWLTYNLTKLASQLDGELFMRLCEVAVYAKHMEAIEAAKESIRDAIRLQQEYDYGYNHEREDNAKPTTH